MPDMPSENEDSRPTAAELMILQTLWALSKPATVREVHDAMAVKRGDQTAYTTTLKLMQIMIDKGLLRREGSPAGGPRGHLYRPCDPPTRTRKRLVRDLIDRAFAGSAKDLVMHALSARRPNGRELDEIVKLISDLKSKPGDKP